jgi:hypothetical protein
MLPFVSFSACSVLWRGIACVESFSFFPPRCLRPWACRVPLPFSMAGTITLACCTSVRSPLYGCIYNLSITSIVTIMEAYIALLREDVNMRGPLTLSLDLDAHPTGFLLASTAVPKYSRLEHGHASRSWFLCMGLHYSFALLLFEEWTNFYFGQICIRKYYYL